MKTPNLPDRYTHTGQILEGGQGRVYVCFDLFLERNVAIKFLKDIADPGTVKREVAAIREIQSKHVVQIFDLINVTDASVGLVQEYLDGSDISPCVDEGGAVVVAQYLRTLFQIASGIADIHAHGCIHRDIKPNNMKFGQESILKIFDFGLAGFAKNNEDTNAGRGTRIFRAPELYKAPVRVHSAIDVYAFGVIAWYLTGCNVPDALAEVPPQTTQAAPSISGVLSNVTAELIGILDSCISPNPDSRPSMVDVARVIERQLLRGRHKARFGPDHSISALGQTTKIKHAYGEIAIKYDGLDFVVNEAVGEVFINNAAAVVGKKLPLSCVITLGSQQRGAYRGFVPFEISHPEVVL